MVNLKDVEVHVVSSFDNREFVEFDNPKALTSSDEHSSEKFIEAITGLAYHIKVNIKPDFKMYAADGIKIRISIDGGVVSFSNFYPRNLVEKRKSTGSPMIFSTVPFREGSVWRNSKYSFGSLNIDEDVEIDKELLDRQASKLGSIKVSVLRAAREKLQFPVKKKGAMYTPFTSANTSKEMVKEKHISHVMMPGETEAGKEPGLEKYLYSEYKDQNCHCVQFLFRYRSRMHLQLLGIIPQSPVSTSTNKSTQPTNSEVDAIKNEDEEQTGQGQRFYFGQVEIDRMRVLEKENRDLYERVQRMNANICGLTTFKDKMTAFLQSLTGSETTTAPVSSPGATFTPSNPSPRSVSIKRERDLTPTNRSSKRSKVIDLTDD